MSKLIKKAFTLIELLVVIAIIGILSGLIVISMGGMTDKANIAKSQVFSNSLKNSLMLNTVGEWKIDEGSGTTVNDTWTKINNGTLYNFTDTTAGYGDSSSHADGWMSSSNCISGACLKFDGVNDYMDCGVDSSITTSLNAWTVSAWVKPNDISVNTLIGFNSSSGAPSIRLNNTTGQPIILMSDTNFRYFSVSAWTTLKNGNWHHVVFTIPGSAQADIANSKMFLDGQEVGVGSTSSTGSQSAKNSLRIGGSYYFGSGLIDEVRMYNAAVPTSQIKEQYYAGLNSLLANGNINTKEYSERINSIAKNEQNN